MKKSVKKKDVKNYGFKFSLNFIARRYRESFDFLKSSKKYIYFVIGVFLVFSFVGFFVPMPGDISDRIINFFRSLILETEGFGFFEMLFYLLENNLYASFFGMALGILLGVVPMINAVVNGFVLGFASKISVAEAGIFSLLRILPHGIFELPALFISLGVGVRMGSILFSKDDFRKTFINSMKTFVLVVIPLLVVAAIIESALIVFFS